MADDISIEAREALPTRWRDIWSARHATSGVDAIVAVADLVARTLEEYCAARSSLTASKR